MNNSFCGSIGHGSSVYRGAVSSTHDCVTGRLFFSSCAERKSSSYSSGAKILVAESNELFMPTLSKADTSDIVAAVIIGNTPSVSAVREAEKLSIPLLTLPSLPRRHNGKIAILDSENASLFVDPDLDVVNRYARAFDFDTDIFSSVHSQISHTAFSTVNEERKPLGVLHVCSAGRRGEMRSEDELFDDYRDLCESVSPLPLTLLLCPAYPFDQDSKERFFAYARAIFRASVYGDINILCGGPCTLTSAGAMNCQKELIKAKDTLDKSRREYNSDIDRGLLISSPLLLLSLEKLSGFDRICLDLRKLTHLFSGISAHAPVPSGALDETFAWIERLLSEKKSSLPPILATADSNTAKRIFENNSLCKIIEYVFIKNI